MKGTKSKKRIAIIIIITLLIEIIFIARYFIKATEDGVPEDGIQAIADGESEEDKVAQKIQQIREKQEELSENWNTDIVDIVESEDEILMPVPKGYVASSIESSESDDGERTVQHGFVIYEGTKDVVDSVNDAKTEDSKEDAQKTRNQWVWVPVPDSSEIYGTDSNGKLWGKLYDYNSTERKGDNYWTETGDEGNKVMNIESSTSYREPDLLTDSTYGDYDRILPQYFSEETKDEINKEFEEEFGILIKSIEEYGGFYIGRYETGDLSKSATKVVKGNSDIHSQNWYTMYEKSKALRGANSNVKTSMIWGCLWDRTLQWLVDSGSKTYSQVGYNSYEWGNYYNSKFQYDNGSGSASTTKSGNSSIIIPAGSTEYTKANNIYDLAGNVWEWTIEARSTSGRVYRGGDFKYHSSHQPADYRYYYDPYNSYTNMR